MNENAHNNTRKLKKLKGILNGQQETNYEYDYYLTHLINVNCKAFLKFLIVSAQRTFYKGKLLKILELLGSLIRVFEGFWFAKETKSLIKRLDFWSLII